MVDRFDECLTRESRIRWAQPTPQKGCDNQVCSDNGGTANTATHERGSEEHDDEVFQFGQERESKLERCSGVVLVHPRAASPMPDEGEGD